MKKLAEALKRKTAHSAGTASLLDQNKTNTRKVELKKNDLFSDIMSDTDSSDALPVPKPTTLTDADVFATPTGSTGGKDLFASLGQTEAGVDMNADERKLFSDLDKEQSKPKTGDLSELMKDEQSSPKTDDLSNLLKDEHSPAKIDDLPNLFKDEQSTPKDGDLSSLLKELKA